MIDLSFLTKEEQETILTVLKRDAELKKLEDQRVQNLQKSVMNKSQLRYLTGEWFYETKQLRHQDRIHGSDIIRASMRRTLKLKTILELSQTSAERCSFVSTESKDVSLPAVCCGVLQEPHMELSNNHYQHQNLDETQQETLKSNSQPRMKQIRNPFNSEPEKESQASDEAVNQSQTKECSRRSSSPITPALKRSSSRSRSSSESLENLTLTSQTTSRLSSSRPMKSSMSEPVLLYNKKDSGGPLETNMRAETNTSSSTYNLTSSVSSSIYPADSAEINVQGSIQFAVNYIQKLGELHIFVMHCRDLATADRKKHRSDPYVKCYLLPDTTKLGKRKTSVKKKTLNPTYSEILTFKVMMQVLKTQSLNVSVWHDSSFGRNRFLGDVNLNLLEWDFSNTQINEYALKTRVSAQASAPAASCLIDSRAQMRVALRFLPQTSLSRRTSTMESTEVQIWVKDCKNLPLVRGLIIDPFVKCTLRPDTSRRSRQRTRVVTRTANPMFNHTMVYDGLRPEDLREVCIELTVWDHGRLDNHYIGGLRLGLGTGESYGVEVSWMDSTTDEADLWQRMLRSDGEWVEDVLPLRMLMMPKSISK
ncbi:synaptotagmin-like protein 2 [Haplochromis burtoni]|uniref:synaptotagmin-like protein 2 n=1 Tax=Haplochromis burtoni TaxID=8153 RepID=UPI001C2D67B0|nr:synaptotagmin-like protein 2 [Haplochromis burtoni]